MINAILRNGVQFKTTRDVVYGPRKYLGIGLRHLGPEQGVQQTLLLLKHLRANQNSALSFFASASLGSNYNRHYPADSRMPERHTSIFRVDGSVPSASFLLYPSRNSREDIHIAKNLRVDSPS
jgi:hypothetical protein